MSLNDPHWGRDQSGQNEAPKQQDPKNTDELRDDEPPLREPRPEDVKPQRPSEPKKEEVDIEELWNNFNERLNAMLGGKQQGRGSASSPFRRPEEDRKDKEDSSFEEPPLCRPQQGGFGGSGRGEPPFDFNRAAGRAPGAMLLAAGVIALGAWIASGFYIVPEGQSGVVTTFGKYQETTAPGFRWHMPYPIQDVDLVDVSSVRKAEIGMRGTTQRLREALMLTDDENIVDVMFNVQYRIKEGHGAEEFLFRTRDPLGAVIQTAESAMREVVGRKKMDSVLFESKLEIAQEVQKLMQEMLDRYHSGIQILSVAIQNAQPPEQVQAAFNDAVKAGQDRERQINEGEAYANDVVPKARGLAERLRQEAEGYKARVVSQAQGDASRFDQVYEQYKAAPKVTRDRMYVDTIQQIYKNTGKVIVDSKSANNLLYLPLDKLIEQSKPAAEPEQTAPAAAAAPAAQKPAAAAGASYSDSANRNYTSRSLSRDAR
jgi:membrane protease subunit HflK